MDTNPKHIVKSRARDAPLLPCTMRGYNRDIRGGGGVGGVGGAEEKNSSFEYKNVRNFLH